MLIPSSLQTFPLANNFSSQPVKLLQVAIVVELAPPETTVDVGRLLPVLCLVDACEIDRWSPALRLDCADDAGTVERFSIY